MKQDRPFYLHADPSLRMHGGLWPANFQLIVHTFDAGQVFHCILGQGPILRIGDSSGQCDVAVLRLGLD